MNDSIPPYPLVRRGTPLRVASAPLVWSWPTCLLKAFGFLWVAGPCVLSSRLFIAVAGLFRPLLSCLNIELSCRCGTVVDGATDLLLTPAASIRAAFWAARDVSINGVPVAGAVGLAACVFAGFLVDLGAGAAACAVGAFAAGAFAFADLDDSSLGDAGFLPFEDDADDDDFFSAAMAGILLETARGSNARHDLPRRFRY